MKILMKNVNWIILLFLLSLTVMSCNDDDDESVPADTEAPVITLIGEDTLNLAVGDTFTDPGAIATDSIDGDITEDIVVGGDDVDTNTAGTYVITYNVSDAAGNAATEVTRTVIVKEITFFDDGLLTNGDFEAGADSWLAGVGTNPAPVVTVDGNTYYSVNIENPDASQPYLVNLSQKVALTQGSTYSLSFDAWSDRARTIIAGIGRSEGDFANDNETVSITDTRTTYTISFDANTFGEENNRVLFDNNGDAGLVNIDNVSLFQTGEGGDFTPPVITLNGESTMYIAVGASFSDPGATAVDNVDGDITENIVVEGVENVDTNTLGTYVITYNVSDAAGNAAVEVRRSVVVTEDGEPGSIVANGDFEDGETGWLFFDNNGTAALDNSLSNGGGSNSAKIVTNGPSNPGIKQERIGVDIVKAGDVVQIQFDHIGSVTQPGAVFNVLLFVERAEGETGDPITHVFDPRPALTGTWTTFTATYTIPSNASVTGGISILIESVCGGDAGCEVSANVDNVSVTLNP